MDDNPVLKIVYLKKALMHSGTTKELKDHQPSDYFKYNTKKYPEKKRKLEELANSLNEFDNPVLIFVTFKK